MLTFHFLKRVFDIFFSIFILIFLIPFFIVIGLLVKCTSKGPIFYKSPRIGKNFKEISCLKFRSMYEDAEERLSSLLESSSEIKKEWVTFQKLKSDPRVTPIGKFLRKTSLDELPQFFDVLQGNLSVVGPRPFCKNQVDDYLKENAKKFLSIKPGITGIWQVSGRSELTFAERLKLEEAYIENASFLEDIKIILRTIPVVFSMKGVY